MDFVRKLFPIFFFFFLQSPDFVDPADDVFHNQFAVHVPGGKEVADRIAAKHGFVNVGQIGSLTNHFLLEHPRIAKRSTDQSLVHHGHLENDADVAWFEQQKELKRKKRDVNTDFEMPGKHPLIHSIPPISNAL